MKTAFDDIVSAQGISQKVEMAIDKVDTKGTENYDKVRLEVEITSDNKDSVQLIAVETKQDN